MFGTAGCYHRFGKIERLSVDFYCFPAGKAALADKNVDSQLFAVTPGRVDRRDTCPQATQAFHDKTKIN